MPARSSYKNFRPGWTVKGVPLGITYTVLVCLVSNHTYFWVICLYVYVRANERCMLRAIYASTCAINTLDTHQSWFASTIEVERTHAHCACANPRLTKPSPARVGVAALKPLGRTCAISITRKQETTLRRCLQLWMQESTKETRQASTF